MKRMAMIRGPRRSAKQSVTDFTTNVIRTLDTQGLPPERQKEFRNHLNAILRIAKDMNWTEIIARVTNWVRSNPIETGSYEGDENGPIAYSKRGIFTEPG